MLEHFSFIALLDPQQMKNISPLSLLIFYMSTT